MGKKLKFALIAMLGFSTACSTAKKAQQTQPTPQPDQQPQSVEEEIPRIKLMYGVPAPYPLGPSVELEPQQQEAEGTANNQEKTE